MIVTGRDLKKTVIELKIFVQEGGSGTVTGNITQGKIPRPGIRRTLKAVFHRSNKQITGHVGRLLAPAMQIEAGYPTPVSHMTHPNIFYRQIKDPTTSLEIFLVENLGLCQRRDPDQTNG